MSADHELRDAVVVGAGISGLAAAWWLRRAGKLVTVLESSDRVGGAITTFRDGEWLFELGPSTVLENTPAIGELIASAGLAERRIGARPAAKRRFLWKDERLVALPSGPLSALTTPLLSPRGKLRVLKEPWIPQRTDPSDESIADFVRRRLGGEMLDYAVGPFVSGVYAGDPERLAVRWATAKIHALEAEHGGLIRGAVARRKGPTPGGGMFSFRDGLCELPARLAAGIGDVRMGVEARRIVRSGSRLAVETAAGTIEAPQVILAVPADAAARLLDEASDGASRALGEIPYAPVVVVALGYARDRIAHPLGGFGFLGPRRESLRMLGCLWHSEIFPGRAPDGHVALTAVVGGRTDEEITTWDDARLLDHVRGELGRAIGAQGEPAFVRVQRWRRAIPQYEIGHGRFVEAAAALERALPGLHVAGNLLRGVSVADCIKNATALAREIEPEGATAATSAAAAR